MGGFEKVALKKAADYAALEFRKTIFFRGGGGHDLGMSGFLAPAGMRIRQVRQEQARACRPAGPGCDRAMRPAGPGCDRAMRPAGPGRDRTPRPAGRKLTKVTDPVNVVVSPTPRKD